TPGRRAARRGARGRRDGRGALGADAPVRRRRPLAPGGRRGRGALRGARRASGPLPRGATLLSRLRGRWCMCTHAQAFLSDGAGPMTLTALTPATEQPIAELDQAGRDETDAAVARAKAAFPAWRAVAPADRARLLRRLATLVEEHGEELARIESQNVGKPIAG